MAAEFLALLAFDDYCGNHPIFVFPFPPPPGPPGPPDPWPIIANNVFYGAVGLALVATMVTHPEQALDIKYGVFALIPAVRVLAGVWYNNMRTRGAGNVKGK